MTRKTTFFEGWSWFKFNNLGLALGIALKFYTSMAKELKLKVRKFLGGKTGRRSLPSIWIGLKKVLIIWSVFLWSMVFNKGITLKTSSVNHIKCIVVTVTIFSCSSKKPGSKAETKRAEGKGNFREEFLLSHILIGY